MKRSLRRALFPAEMCFNTMVASQIRTKKKLDEDKPFHEEKSKKSHVSCKNVFQYHGGLPNSNNKIKNKKKLYDDKWVIWRELYSRNNEIYSQRHFSKIGYLQERAVKVRKGSKFQMFKHLKRQGLLNGLI